MSFRTIEDHMRRISWQHVRERKFILFSSNNIRDTSKNYVLYTLKPHNNQLFYAMKMGKPKDAINYRRIIYWRQWQIYFRKLLLILTIDLTSLNQLAAHSNIVNRLIYRQTNIQTERHTIRSTDLPTERFIDSYFSGLKRI